MNLYKIIVQHSAPKDTIKAIAGFVFAKNDEDVFNHITKEYNTYWDDVEKTHDEEGEEELIFEIYDEKWNVIGTENFKEKIIRIKGEMNDDDYDYSDSHYGVTLYGWELLTDKTVNDLNQLISLLDVKTA